MLKAKEQSAGGTPWLVSRTIKRGDACQGLYRHEYVTVSHRWESVTNPDPESQQLACIAARIPARLHHSMAICIFWDAPGAAARSVRRPPMLSTARGRRGARGGMMAELLNLTACLRIKCIGIE